MLIGRDQRGRVPRQSGWWVLRPGLQFPALQFTPCCTAGMEGCDCCLLRSWPRLGWAILILGVVNLAYP